MRLILSNHIGHNIENVENRERHKSVKSKTMMKQHISTKLRSSILPTFHVIAKLTLMILIVQCNELRDKSRKSNLVTKACSWKMILKRDFTDSLHSVVTHYEWLNSHWDIPSLSIIKNPHFSAFPVKIKLKSINDIMLYTLYQHKIHEYFLPNGHTSILNVTLYYCWNFCRMNS